MTQIICAAITAVATIVVAIVGGWQVKNAAKQKTANDAAQAAAAKQKLIEEGLQAILRDRILQACDRCLDKGYLPIYARENIEHMYKAYHGLGGNGTVTKLIDRIYQLPFEPEDK